MINIIEFKVFPDLTYVPYNGDLTYTRTFPQVDRIVIRYKEDNTIKEIEYEAYNLRGASLDYERLDILSIITKPHKRYKLLSKKVLS